MIDTAPPRHSVNSNMAQAISGWAIDPSRPDRAVTLTFHVDGRLAATVPATRPRNLVKKLYGGEGRHGFVAVLPLIYYDGQPRRLVITRRDTGEILFDADVAFDDLRWGDGVHGVCRFGRHGVEGWIVDGVDSEACFDIELVCDDAVVARVTADRPVDALPFLEEPRRRHGFSIRYPDAMFDDAPHRVEVRQARTGRTCEVAEVTLSASTRPHWQGRLRIDGSRLSGSVWSASPHGGHPVPISLLSGHARFATRLVNPDEPFDFDVLEGLQTLEVTGRLIVVAGDHDRLRVRGDDALLSWLSLADAFLDTNTHALTLVVAARCDKAHLAHLRIVIDGAERTLTVRLAGGLGRMVIDLPPGWGRLDIGLTDEPRFLPGLSFTSAAAPQPASAGAFVSPADPAVTAALAMVSLPFRREIEGTGHSGEWVLDAVARRVEGWVLNIADPTATFCVNLVVDGVAATRTQSGSPASLMSGAPIGFSFDISDIETLQPFSLIGVELVDGRPLGTGPATPYATGGAVGHIERASWCDFKLEVVGWAIDFTRPGEPVRVGLFIDERLITETVTGRGEAEGGDRFCVTGFAGPVDLDGRIAVRLLDTSTDIAVPPVELSSSLKPREPLKPTHRAAPDDEIVGVVEAVSDTVITGWALNQTDPERPPDLLLMIEGEAILHDRPRVRRDDVIRAQSADGAHGFEIEIPPNLAWTRSHAARLDVATGRSRLSGAQFWIPSRQPDVIRGPSISLSTEVASVSAAAEKATVIVLNRDGAALLSNLFASVLEHEADSGAEWLVIDHQSHDDSEEVCARARADGLDVRFVPRAGNFNFSQSNNLGAALAKHERLVLMNNDILLTQPVLARLMAALDDPSIGLAGVRLLDAVGPVGGAAPVQHLGMFMTPNLTRDMMRAFEARSTPETEGVLDGPSHVPAVTGALCAIRRADLLAIGGLDEGYRYGHEDIDLALTLSTRLGLSTVCLNDVDAVHHRGFTRRDGSDHTPLMLNRRRFNQRWGGAVRHAVRRDRVHKPAFWTGSRPIIGLAVDGGPSATEMRDYAAALGDALQALCSAHVRLIEPQNWTDLSGVDVLLALSPKFSPRGVTAARPSLDLGAIRFGPARAWAEVDTAVYDWAWEADDPTGLARVIHADLDADRQTLKFAIKTPARGGQEASWGDYHFAVSLAQAIRDQGHRARIDLREQWGAGLAATDDVVVVLRGLAAYRPHHHQTNFLWLISHPDDVAARELSSYDTVFVASDAYADRLAGLTDTPVETLLQCTDPTRFHTRRSTPALPATDILFVGNARGVFRDAVKWAIDAGVSIAVYGDGWDGLLPDGMLKGRYVPNEILGDLYGSARAVLCDHWLDMRRNGFLSNRIFDVLASGGRLIVDDIEGLDRVLPPEMFEVVRGPDDLRRIVAEAEPAVDRAGVATHIAEHHSFAARARRLIEAAQARRVTLPRP